MEVRTEAVRAVLGGSDILKGVDMRAGDRELVGIIGPNGSGKSTLLKCIYRVLKPAGGAVWLDGRELDTYSHRQSALRLAVVAQHNFYNFEFSVKDVVLMGRAPHKRALDRDNAEDFAIVDRALATVGLAAFAERSFSTLSGGEQQRVILARALAQQTPCLILDEPTNHLDIKYQLELMDIVKGLDCTVISAIHDLNIAAMYCDRLYAVKGGEIVASGTPEAVLTPETIRMVYEVEAEVVRGRDGTMHILYHPGV
ncbi:ABC transporter [Oscillospiraceae bacterium]|nr:ABC transporter [Oscillospiraceae bacterium]BDF74570.1 ABC transporter [Oscillospiraceae bacterium]